MPQPAHVVLHFLPDVLGEIGSQVVHGAGEHEVLPHQQAQFVAGIVEGVVRVAAAAPHPNTVEVGRRALLQQMPGALRGDPGQDVVLGDVVGAHGEDLHPVHLVGKALPVLVLLPGNGHGPQADAPLPGIHLHPVQKSGDLHRVKGLVPVAAGPPQPGMLNEDLPGGALIPGDLPLRVGHLRGVGEGFAVGIGKLRLQRQGDPAARVALPDKHRLQLASVDPQQVHRPPESGVGQMRAPVPAEHAVGLPQVGKALHGVGAALGGVLLVRFPNPLGGGVEPHLEVVLPLPKNSSHVVLEGAVHVLHMVQQHPVKPDVRHGVHALKAQHLVGAFQNSLRRGEILYVVVVVLHQGKSFQLVVPVVGVLHLSRRQQVGVHGPGHPGRKLFSLVGHGQRPLFGQLLYDHTVPPSGRPGISLSWAPRAPWHHSNTVNRKVNAKFLFFSQAGRWPDSARWSKGSAPPQGGRKPLPWRHHTAAAGSRTAPKAPPGNPPGPF